MQDGAVKPPTLELQAALEVTGSTAVEDGGRSRSLSDPLVTPLELAHNVANMPTHKSVFSWSPLVAWGDDDPRVV